jgi:hypothetical protein
VIYGKKHAKHQLIDYVIATRPNVSYLINLLCLMPEDLAHRGENSAPQWLMALHPNASISLLFYSV